MFWKVMFIGGGGGGNIPCFQFTVKFSDDTHKVRLGAPLVYQTTSYNALDGNYLHSPQKSTLIVQLHFQRPPYTTKLKWLHDFAIDSTRIWFIQNLMSNTHADL